VLSGYVGSWLFGIVGMDGMRLEPGQKFVADCGEVSNEMGHSYN